MKYPNIFEVLGRILYLIWKEGISYQVTQERAVIYEKTYESN